MIVRRDIVNDRIRSLAIVICIAYVSCYCVFARAQPGGSLTKPSKDQDTIRTDLRDSRAAQYKEAFTLQGHDSAVYSVAFSPNGQMLASGSGDNTIRLWSMMTRRMVLSVKETTGMVCGVTFDPKGHNLASATCDGKVTIRNAGTGVVSGVHEARGWSVSYRHDGGKLASVNDATIIVRDVGTGQEVVLADKRIASFTTAVFSPVGNRIASASRETIIVWDTEQVRRLFTMNGHSGWVWTVAFGPDGARLASGSSDKAIRIWDAANGLEIHTLQGHSGAVLTVAFSPDGKRLASGSADGTVRIWNAVTFQELATLRGHAKSVMCVSFSPDGKRLASASIDKLIKVWESDP